MSDAVAKYSNGMTNTSEETAITMYQGASTLIISEEAEKILDEPIAEEDVEIRPDGLIYPPQIFYREKLNRAFGRGQWALIKHNSVKDPDRDKVYFDGSLFIRGCFIARATGEAEYHASNPNQSWASVEEAAKSDCIVRCSKDLGIFRELWKPQFSRDWIKKYGVKVFVEKNEKISVAWRKVGQPPYWNEKGFVPDSPNRDSAKKPADVKPVAKPEVKPEPIKEVTPSKNYTAIVNACTTIEELQSVWESLTKTEQKNYKALVKERKAELIKASSLSLDEILKDMQVINFNEYVKLAEDCVSGMTDMDEKANAIGRVKARLKELGIKNYEVQATAV